mmetsp:Transcript_24750/g.57142  ORF Transcript_24750/g.57142 Transcript_24750/m.57142 type:complete len:492 (+) Transcript_24750:124-1599(+)
MAELLQAPPPLRQYGVDLNFSRDKLRGDRCSYDVHPVFQVPYTRIENCGYPAFFDANAVLRMQQEWTCRPDDVFIVGGTTPNLVRHIAGFVEGAVGQNQPEMVPVAKDFPRWIDAAASRRGWQYVEALDKIKRPRLLTTHCVPWLFPCRNSGLPRTQFPSGWSSLRSSTASECSSDAGCPEPPKMAVIITDPRVLVMRELQHTLLVKQGWSNDVVKDADLALLLEGLLGPCDDLLPGLTCSEAAGIAAWAEAEQQFPERIRLFFIDDFVTQPATALRGLLNFLEIPSASIDDANVPRDLYDTNGTLYTTVTAAGDFSTSPALPGLVEAFERILSQCPDFAKRMWEDSALQLLQSPNSRLVTVAQGILVHKAWDVPGFWAAHSARLCRPCLFFPRGTCRQDEECEHCHLPDHTKPKRPNKSRRQRRKGNHHASSDRTPSPSPELAFRQSSIAQSNPMVHQTQFLTSPTLVATVQVYPSPPSSAGSMRSTPDC